MNRRSQPGALGSNETDFSASRIEHLEAQVRDQALQVVSALGQAEEAYARQQELEAQVQRQRELLMQAREALAYYKDAERPEDTCGGGYWSLADDGKTAREAIAAIDALEPAEPVKGEPL